MEISFISWLIVIFGMINLIRMATFLIASDYFSLMLYKRKKTAPDQSFPTISVVIPAHNEEATILGSIKSVIASDYPSSKLQLVVVDDGSTDNTVLLIKKYISQNKTFSSQIKLVIQPNSGKASALNNGISNYCNSELVMCLDADSRIDPQALKNAAFHFSDPKVSALSANVKISKRHGLLNLIQIYEYLVCYQMKRAECLFNCEYIVGGIGSTFRKSVLEKVNYYDTNTVTEDIDLTMKILQLGNKDHLVIYGSDVIAYTESVLTIGDLIKQRYRWKWGRCQTFIKNSSMFFSPDKKYTKSLSWMYLPYAIYGDIAYFLEPVILSYILFISVYFKDPMTIISAWCVITVYMSFNILAEDTIKFSEKLYLILLTPLMYVFFYLLSFVEYVALIKSLININNLKKSLDQSDQSWKHVARTTHDEQTYTASIKPNFAYRVVLACLLLLSIIYFSASKIRYYETLSTASNTILNQPPSPTTAPTLVEIDPPNSPPQIIEHLVKSGESLWKISRQYYGNGVYYNRFSSTSPNHIIHPGDVIKITVSKLEKSPRGGSY